ncbi:MAG: lamin tail domain-containing protein [Bacteroidetes bacterium]|nr:lamin tail domain-containing protein [Bacteroidota bacterium]
MKKLLLLIASVFFSVAIFSQECSDLFISEYVEGSGNNKAIELYNPTNEPIDLGDYKLVRYSNGGTTPYGVNLGGTIQPKSTYVVVLDKRVPGGTGYEEPVDSLLQLKADTFLCPIYEVNRMMYFNGNDAVSLERISNGAIVDLFGFVGPPMTSEDNGWGSLNDTTISYNSGGDSTSYTIANYIVGPLFWLSWTKDNTLIRKPDVGIGVKLNPAPYFVVYEQWDSIPKNTFVSLGFHDCNCSSFGIAENSVNVNVSIYPNPVVNGEFTIEAGESIDEVKIIDISGRLIEFKQLEGQTGSVKVSITDKLKGFYFVNIRLSSGQITTKKLLLKQ